jgi:hypothetical protein
MHYFLVTRGLDHDSNFLLANGDPSLSCIFSSKPESSQDRSIILFQDNRAKAAYLTKPHKYGLHYC